MNFFKEMFNPKGSISFTRFFGMLIIICGLVFYFMYPELWSGGLAMVGLGLTGKVIQKIME